MENNYKAKAGPGLAKLHELRLKIGTLGGLFGLLNWFFLSTLGLVLLNAEVGNFAFICTALHALINQVNE